jgi:hypothetical protein
LITDYVIKCRARLRVHGRLKMLPGFPPRIERTSGELSFAQLFNYYLSNILTCWLSRPTGARDLGLTPDQFLYSRSTCVDQMDTLYIKHHKKLCYQQNPHKNSSIYAGKIFRLDFRNVSNESIQNRLKKKQQWFKSLFRPFG